MLSAVAITFVIASCMEAGLKGSVSELVFLPMKEREFLWEILYQGIGCSIFAFFLSNVAISKIGVNRTSSFIGIAMVISIVAGAIILEEPFTFFQMIGAAIIIAGVYIANMKMTKE